MILFLNVFITDKGITLYDRGQLGPPKNRLDVFKYALASYAVLPFDQVIIYCELDDNYRSRQDELETFIRGLFRDPVIRFHRNLHQREWQKALEELFTIQGDNLVWFFCNDDHIFVDYELGLLERILARLKTLSHEHEFVSCNLSHWAEALPLVNGDYRIPDAPGEVFTAPIEETKDYFIKVWGNCAAVQIVNFNLLRYWWFAHDYGDARMPRTDNSARDVVSPPNMVCMVPLRELVRHFDASSHIKMSINACPPLSIPEGFFEKQVKISFCADQRRKGFVHVNPMIENYVTVDHDGVDMRCLLEDLPLFWKPYISEVVTAREIDRSTLTRARNEAVMKLASTRNDLPLEYLEEKLSIALRDRHLPECRPQWKRPTAWNTEQYSSVFKDSRVSAPSLSIVLIDENRSGNGNHAIDSLLRQDCVRDLFEIVYVSTEEMFDRGVLAFVDTAIRSNQSQAWKYGAFHSGMALNAGILRARGLLLTLADTHTIFPPNFVSSTLKEFTAEDSARELLQYQEFLVSDFSQGKSTLRCSRNCLTVQKSEVVAVGGCDEKNSYLGKAGGAWELTRRLMKNGTSTKVAPASCTMMRLAESFPELAVESPVNTEHHLPVIENRAIKFLRLQEISSNAENYGAILSDAIHLFCVQNKWDEALSFLSYQSSRFPESMLLGTFFGAMNALKTGDFLRACALSETLVKDYPNEIEILSFLGFVSLVNKNFRDAETILLSALRRDPANINSRVILDGLLERQGRIGERLMNQVELIRYYPRNAAHIEQAVNLQRELQNASRS